MKYPLKLALEILVAAPRVTLTDADGFRVYYAKQRLLRPVEEVKIYADRSQATALYRIRADQIIDVLARYYITDVNGIQLGSVEMDAMDLSWKAHYRICSGSAPSMTIEEESGLLGAIDSFCTQIPFVGPVLSACLINPSYRVSAISDQHVVMWVKKQPSLFQRKFVVQRIAELEPADETLVLLSLLMMVILERRRG